MTKLFLGFTMKHEVVFGEVEYREGRFSASFDTSYPMAIGHTETIERIEDYIDCNDAQYILNWLKQYDCTPSDLAQCLYQDTYDHIQEFFDNSLYTEMFNVDGVEDDVYFLASSCGQHDTRKEMGYTINYPLYDYIHELWDEYHLKEMPIEKWNKLIEAVEHQNNTINEEAIIQNYLNRNFNK